MTRRMSAGSQIAFTRSWLERQGIEAQTIDVEAQIDPSLSYEENIKLMKRQFKLGGGRSRQKAARGLSAAECDVAIGNYEAGYNGEEMRDACLCGHPDACVDLERAQRAAKPEQAAGRHEIAWQAARSQQRAAVPPALAPAPKRRQPAAKPAKKPKKTAAKPAKNGKAKKPAPELTAAQRKRLNAKGSVTIKRGGKFVTVTR